jgi:iron complex transport system ATP-binding protein
MLEIKELYFSYDKKVQVLKDLNLSVLSGEFIGIVGPNGCGKSTLINLLCRVLEIKEGKIYFDNRILNEISQLELAQKIAVVPQESYFEFDFTALEIVLMGRLPYLTRFQLEGAEDRKIAKAAMKKTKCWEFRDKYIKNLSGGEKQRVIVARALVQDPEYLLLDEPTSHLDLNFQYEILDVVSRLNKRKNVTIISVFHDINLASRYCSRLIIMKSGRIIADGKPISVINSENLDKIYDFKIILKKHPKQGYKYILPDMESETISKLKIKSG